MVYIAHIIMNSKYCTIFSKSKRTSISAVMELGTVNGNFWKIENPAGRCSSRGGNPLQELKNL